AEESDIMIIKGVIRGCIDEENKQLLEMLFKKKISHKIVCDKCNKCNRKEKFKYIFEEDNDPKIIFIVHDHFKSLWQVLQYYASILIIEEEFLNKMIDEGSFLLESLQHTLDYVQENMSGNKKIRRLIEQFDRYIKTQNTESITLKNKVNWFTDKKEIKNYANYLLENNYVGIIPIIVNAWNNTKTINEFVDSFDIIGKEIFYEIDYKILQEDSYSIVINDASTPIEALEKFFNSEISNYNVKTHYEYFKEHNQSKTPKILSLSNTSLSMRYLLKNDKKQLQLYTERLARILKTIPDKKVVVFCQSKLKQSIEDVFKEYGLENYIIDHYWSSTSTGSNDYLDYDIAVLFGGAFVNPKAIHKTMKKFNLTSNEAFELHTLGQMYQAGNRIRLESHNFDGSKMLIILSDKIPKQFQYYEPVKTSPYGLESKFTNHKDLKEEIFEVIKENEGLTIKEIRAIVKRAKNLVTELVHKLHFEERITLTKEKTGRTYKNVWKSE
ncbi:MAG: hypothetical protein ACTSPI_02735, partial [Candidatus Heimdallarchaeaceae archaeon]